MSPPDVDYDYEAELDQKVVESLQSIVGDYKTMRISRAQARAAIDAIWQATSGMCSDHVMNAISETAAWVVSLPIDPQPMNAYVKGTDYFSVTWAAGFEDVVVQKNGHKKAYYFGDKEQPFRAASEFFNKITKQMDKNPSWIKI